MPKMTFLLHIGLPSLSSSSFKSWFQVLPSQLDSWPRNQLYWGKSQLWPIDSQTSWKLTHINIMNSYEPFDQVWITIPQEIWSDHQKGKMVIFRVLTAQRQFLTVWPSQWQTKLTYGLKDPNGIVLTCSTSSKRSQIHKIDSWISQSIDQFWLYTEKSNFDFLVKIKSQDSFFIKTFQIMKLVHQEITKCKLGFENEIFHNLEFF